MDKIKQFIKQYKGYIFIFFIAVLALKVFVPQLDGLKDAIAVLADADMYWVIIGTLVYISGLPILAMQYMALALKPIKFWLTLQVQVAGLFVSKLLPSSLGTLSLNLYYLTQKQHSVIQSTAVMSMNAITSGIAYSILILVALAASDFKFGLDLLEDISINRRVVIIFTIILALVVYFIIKTNIIKKKLSATIKDLNKSLKNYKNKKSGILWGILLNGIGSFTSLFALYASALALGVDLSLSQALLAYTFGNIAAGLVPVPGGLGAAEAGIYAGLTLVGVESTSAISVTLLYRLITYWLPIIPGYIAFWNLRKSVLSNFRIKQ